MSENIRKRKNSKYYYYDIIIDGIRYKGTTVSYGHKTIGVYDETGNHKEKGNKAMYRIIFNYFYH